MGGGTSTSCSCLCSHIGMHTITLSPLTLSRLSTPLITISPYFPQSNGLAERAVQTMKQLIQDSQDPYLPLLSYRTTPFSWCDISPAELLMGRRLQASMPQLGEHLSPKWPDMEDFRQNDHDFKMK